MPIIFSHETALEILRSIPPQARLLRSFSGEIPLDGEPLTTDYRELARLDPADFGIRRRPLHVLVGRGRRRSQSSHVSSHEYAEPSIPYALLWGFDPGLTGRAGNNKVFLTCPEVTFAQLARNLSLVEAVCLGFELCGAYSHFAVRVSGFYDRAPLTGTAHLLQALAFLEGSRGLGHAREALGLVLDGSRSPMETVAACELSFPAELGGHGFVAPSLNHEVALDAVASRLAGKKRCSIDIAWPEAKVGIEYNGREFHLDAARDRKRLEALEHMGWSIRTVEASDLGDLRRLDAIAGTLDGRVPRRADGATGAATRRERAAFHKELLSATCCGLGLGAALFGVDVRPGAVPIHI